MPRRVFRSGIRSIRNEFRNEGQEQDVDMGSVRLLDVDTISFSCEINNSTVDDFIETLAHSTRELQKFNTLGNALQPRIKLIFTTEGGVIYDAFRMANAITHNPFQVDIYASGMVASSGLIILMASEAVYSYEHTFFLYHQMRGGLAGTHHEMHGTFQHMQDLNGYLRKMYLEKTSLTEDFLQSIASDEHWFDANTALEYGFVDRLV